MDQKSDPDRVYNFIIRYIVENGPAPHYTDIASELGFSMEEGRQALHDLFAAGAPGWLYPNTDYIATFPPFSSLPTQYRITIEGRRKWHAL